MPAKILHYSLTIAFVYLIISAFYILYFFKDKKIYHKYAKWILVFNFLFHGFFIFFFGKTEGKIPLTSTFEVMTLLGLLLAGIYLIIEHLSKVNSIGAFIFPLIFIFQLVSSFGLRIFEIDSNIFKTPLFGIHTLSAIAGYSAFIFSTVLSTMYLNLLYQIKANKLKFMYDRFPPLETIDRINVICLVVGLVFLTIGIVSGYIWAKIVWIEFSLFDPKIFTSIILWLVYLVSVFMRYAMNWGGRKISFMSLIGFTILIFSFIFVNIFFSTLHEFKL